MPERSRLLLCESVTHTVGGEGVCGVWGGLAKAALDMPWICKINRSKILGQAQGSVRETVVTGC